MSQTLDKDIMALAELVAQETADPNNPLVSPKQATIRIAQQLQHDLESISSSCREGIDLCMTTLKELALKDSSIDVQAIIDEFTKAAVALDSSEKMEKMGMELIDGKSWKEILHIKDRTIRTLYKAATHIFNERRYQDAINAFMFLVTLDPKTVSYWLGLGHAAFHKKDFALAVNAYSMSNVCDPDSVWPHIYAANAFEEQHDFSNALMALQEALEVYSYMPHKDPEIEQSLQSRISNLKNRV